MRLYVESHCQGDQMVIPYDFLIQNSNVGPLTVIGRFHYRGVSEGRGLNSSIDPYPIGSGIR